MKNEFIDLPKGPQLSKAEILTQSADYYKLMSTRRTVREFSSDPVDLQVIENCIRTAGTAPSGANQQPWHFAIITDPKIKKEIRLAAEAEESEFYAGRAGEVWLETLEHLGTHAKKPFLEQAPVLIAIFEQKYTINETGKRVKHYYAKESTGIATGTLISAIHNAGLASLTHTPSPMKFLSNILDRPDGERPFLLLVVGHPAEKTMVPNITKKSLSEISSRY